MGSNLSVLLASTASYIDPLFISASAAAFGFGSGSVISINIDTGSLATTGSNTFVDNQIISGSLIVTNGISGSLYNKTFTKNNTLASGINVILSKENVFNHGNLLIQFDDTLLIEEGAEYFILGDLTNSGSIIVSGSLIIHGVIYNTGNIIGPGPILSNSTLVTYDKANVPYGFLQLDSSGNITNTISLLGTASFATTASYINPLFISASATVAGIVTNSQTSSFITYLQTGSFATTGSNTFSGSQTITGSVNIAGQTNFNNAVAVNDSNLNLTNSSSLNLTSGSSIFINNGLFVVTGSTLVNISGEVNVNNAVAVNDSNVNLTNSSSLNLTSGSSIFVDSGSLTVTNGGITGSLYNEAFSKNRTTPTSINTIKQYQSIFNPSNLFIGENDIFIVEQNSEYYVLGDVVNSGSMVVDGTFKIGGALLNDGNITGIGIIE